MRKFFNDEAGFVVSAELALIVTLIFTAVAVGVAVARDALVTEYNDISEMIGVMNQSYNVQGQSVDDGALGTKPHGVNAGFGYNDQSDVCDCKAVLFPEVCGKDDPSNTGNAEGT
jgi:Flp pilus assembly pilin Flp